LLTSGKGKYRDKLCVQLVDPEGAIFGQVGFALVGSMLTCINGEDISAKTLSNANNILRAAWEGVPAVELAFKHGDFADEILGGQVLARMSSKLVSVGSMYGGTAAYQTKYYAFCERTKLFIFDSKEHFEQVMIDNYNGRKLESVEFYKLGEKSPLCCGEIKQKNYKSHGMLYYFELKAPSTRYTAAKFASDSWEPLNRLRGMIQDALQPENSHGSSSSAAVQRLGLEHNLTSLSDSAPNSFGGMRGSITCQSTEDDNDNDNNNDNDSFHGRQDQNSDVRSKTASQAAHPGAGSISFAPLPLCFPKGLHSSALPLVQREMCPEEEW
jgi:hypothetical protein